MSDITEAATATALDILRHRIDEMERAKVEQPAKLAAARAAADEARGWSLIEEPWETNVSAVPTQTADGRRTGDALRLPSITAKELFGARLAFDILDAGEDDELRDDIKSRYFTMVGGDTGMAFLLFAAALDTIAGIVVPQLLDDVEQQGSNYDARVLLAEARTKAWSDRVARLRGPHDQAGGGVAP